MVRLGKDTQTGSYVEVNSADLESSLYMLGVPGVGKSSLLAHIALDEIKNGNSVIVFDPSGGDLINTIIARIPEQRVNDTYLFDLTDQDWIFGMNIFALPKGQEKGREARDSVRSMVMHCFERLWPEVSSGLYFKNALRPIISTLIERPELTLANVLDLFDYPLLRRKLVAGLENQEAQNFWRNINRWQDPSERRLQDRLDQRTDPLRDRLQELLSVDVVRRIICQKHAHLDIRKLILEHKIILVNLPVHNHAYKQAARIIGLFFMTLIHGAIFGLKPHERTPVTLILDEFENFATIDNEVLLLEGRKYGVRQIIAHQTRDQLDRDGITALKSATTAAFTKICFRTNERDSMEMARTFAGLLRQPAIIETNVLDNLGKHKNATVRDFSIYYISKLKAAASMSQGSYGSLVYNFGFGDVEFNPRDVRNFLTRLNEELYEAQRSATTPKSTTIKVRRSEIYEKEPFKGFDNIDREYRIEGYYETSDLFAKAMGLAWKLKTEDLELKQYIQELEKKIMYYGDQKEAERNKFLETYHPSGRHYGPHSMSIEPELDEFDKRLDAKWKRVFDTLQHPNELKKDFWATITFENPPLEAFNNTFERVVQILMREPITLDSPDVPLDEIAIKLSSLRKRTACVKIESAIYEMETLDLDSLYWSSGDVWGRYNQVIAQTKKFCRGRAEIDKEIRESRNPGGRIRDDDDESGLDLVQ